MFLYKVLSYMQNTDHNDNDIKRIIPEEFQEIYINWEVTMKAISENEQLLFSFELQKEIFLKLMFLSTSSDNRYLGQIFVFIPVLL